MSSASKIVFYHHLRACAQAGLPPSRAIEIAKESCEERSLPLGLLVVSLLGIMGTAEAPALGVSLSTLQDIAARLRGGGEFSQALDRHAAEFPAWEIAIIKVGEKTGRIDQAFGFIEDILDRRRAVLLAKAARSAGPLTAQLLIPWIVFAPICYLAGLLVYLGVVVIACFLALGPRLLSGRGASFKPKDSPGFAKIRFTQCLAWLVKAGVSVDESIELAAGAAGLAPMIPVGRSETAHERLRRYRIFSNEDLGSIKVGEMAGKLDAVLEVLAKDARRLWNSDQGNTEAGLWR